jgi:hypothetical protein
LKFNKQEGRSGAGKTALAIKMTNSIAEAVGKVMAATALLCLIAFYIGVATGGN